MGADYYAALGVAREADEATIKKAFRARARELHPDVNRHDPEAEEKFKALNEAYEVLSDPRKRAMYDRFGTVRPEQAGGFGGGFGFDPISDVFGMFFGDMAGAQAVDLSGRDVVAEVEVELTEAAFGGTKEIGLERLVKCEACSGTGARSGTSASTCASCGGRGAVRTQQRTFLGTVMRDSTCKSCGGLGEVIAEPCPECHGHGRKGAQETLTVDIPSGVDDGMTLRVAAAGEAGIRGGSAGDLFVHLKVRPHAVFERHGDDLYAVLPLTFAQAALGAKLTVDTLDGQARVDVPSGTQPGERIVLKGSGVPRLGGRGRGDLIVETTVVVPTKLSKEDKSLIERLKGDGAGRGKARLVPPRGGVR